MEDGQAGTNGDKVRSDGGKREQSGTNQVQTGACMNKRRRSKDKLGHAGTNGDELRTDRHAAINVDKARTNGDNHKRSKDRYGQAGAKGTKQGQTRTSRDRQVHAGTNGNEVMKESGKQGHTWTKQRQIGASIGKRG